MGCSDSKIPYVINGGILKTAGMNSGKGLGDSLRKAQKAQRQGKFSTTEGAIAWLRQNARSEICLLSGGDVMEVTGMKPGPGIGKALAALFDAQMAGKVKNRGDALAWIKAFPQGKTTV